MADVDEDDTLQAARHPMRALLHLNPRGGAKQVMVAPGEFTRRLTRTYHGSLAPPSRLRLRVLLISVGDPRVGVGVGAGPERAVGERVADRGRAESAVTTPRRNGRYQNCPGFNPCDGRPVTQDTAGSGDRAESRTTTDREERT